MLKITKLWFGKAMPKLTGWFSLIVEKGVFFLQKCTKCNTQFRWGKIFKSYKWTHGPLECVKCGTIHNITMFGRCTVAVLTVLPMQIFCLFLSPFDNIFVTICAGLLIAIVGFLLSPYVAQYKEKSWENTLTVTLALV